MGDVTSPHLTERQMLSLAIRRFCEEVDRMDAWLIKTGSSKSQSQRPDLSVLQSLSIASSNSNKITGVQFTAPVNVSPVSLTPTLPPILKSAVQAPPQVVGPSPLPCGPGGPQVGGPPGGPSGLGSLASGGDGDWEPPQSSGQPGSGLGGTDKALGSGSRDAGGSIDLMSSGGPGELGGPVGPAGPEGSGLGVSQSDGNTELLPQNQVFSEVAVKQVSVVPCDTSSLCNNGESCVSSSVGPFESASHKDVKASPACLEGEVYVVKKASVVCVLNQPPSVYKEFLYSHELKLLPAVVLMYGAVYASFLLLNVAVSLTCVGGTHKLAFAKCCHTQNDRRGVG